jgi:hypothetical protein
VILMWLIPFEYRLYITYHRLRLITATASGCIPATVIVIQIATERVPLMPPKRPFLGDHSREVPSKSFGRSAPNPFRLPRPSVGAHLARKDARQSAISGAAGPSSRRDFCYERVSRKPGRYPGRNSISAADVTNRLGTTRWTSTPSQFVNPEMTECSPAASARKPSRPTRSAGSNPSKGHPAPRYFLEL